MKIQAKAVIFACGCRERPRGGINVAGSRCAGIFSAGTAQKLINIDGYMPGKEVVILGSGDIGLIMARRMTFEGAKVKAVVELMPYSSGLNRNIVQCVKDFDIPLMFSHTVVDIKGEGRVTGVVIAQVDDKLQPIMSTAKEIPCDTLLLSIGLIPQNELATGADVTLSPITGGAVVDENMMTSVDGVFECGNILHVHDLVDFVSKESEEAGRSAAEFIKTGSVDRNYVETRGVDGVRYVVPQRLSKDCKADKLQMKLRVGNVFKNVRLVVEADGEEIYSKKKQIVTPGEMESIVLNEDQIRKAVKCKMLSVALRG
jgi:NADPH-dependent 2,4-dienoyl-CoA reductase/sulfur reductase-like enzyme